MKPVRIAILGTIMLLQCPFLIADTAESLYSLAVKPSSCAVLEEGDMCYVTVNISWQTLQAGEFCIFKEGSVIELKCWAGANEGVFSDTTTLTKSVDYLLVNRLNKQVLARDTVTVSWVYKKRSRPMLHWRVF